MASRLNRPTRTKTNTARKKCYTHAVSACLAGVNCTFKCGSRPNRKVLSLFKRGLAIAVCPEIAGGMGAPRERSEISGGAGIDVISGKARVMSSSGRDVTLNHLYGAKKLSAIIRSLGITTAILRSHSPSCGTGRVYDGSFSGKLTSGDGVFAAMLRKDGLMLHDEKGRKR